MSTLSTIISLIQDSFNIHSVTLTDQSTLEHFSPDELDIAFFLAEVALEFDIDLVTVYGDRLLTTPLFEISDYIERNKHE
jgi:hypothetical protein